MMGIIDAMRKTAKTINGIESCLSRRAAWACATPEIKSYDYFLRTLIHSVHMVYDGYMAGDFIDVMASLIQGQLTRAYQEGVQEAGLDIDEMTSEMHEELEKFILSEFDYVDRFYRDIVDARIDEQPVEPLLARAQLWANRYNDVKNAAMRTVVLIKGGKLVWRLGATEEHCVTCNALNGIVAFAKEWEASGYKPQSPPNPLLECKGWNCGCSLTETSARRSPKALKRLLDMAVTRYV